MRMPEASVKKVSGMAGILSTRPANETKPKWCKRTGIVPTVAHIDIQIGERIYFLKYLFFEGIRKYLFAMGYNDIIDATAENDS